MKKESRELRSRRAGAHYGQRCLVSGRPAMKVKVGKREDYVTTEEFLEDMYGQRVLSITLEDGTVLQE